MRIWEQSEVDFIIRNHQSYTDKEIGDLLGRSENSIRVRKSIILTDNYGKKVARILQEYKKLKPYEPENWEELHIKGVCYDPKDLTGWELETYNRTLN